MRLDWLEDILAVAETGSFSEAAEKRRLTQSAFSRRIQNIETYVGADLFDRSRKPVQLRPTTQDQHAQIARLAVELRQLVTDLRRGDRTTTNRIVIASQHALTTALTPSILDSIQVGHADIFMKLRSANLDECFALLLSRQADIAIVYRLPDTPHPINADYIETAVVGADRLIPVFAAAKSAVLNDRFEQGELPYIAYPSEVFFGQVMDRLVLPSVRRISDLVAKAETALTLAAVELAAVGVAVAWVPLSLAQNRLKTGELLDLSASLPSVGLDVTAVRLLSTSGPVATAIWGHLLGLAPQAAVR